MSPLSAEILVPQMHIRKERSGLNAVRLQGEALATAVTKHYSLEIGQIRRITHIRVAPARDCTLVLNSIQDATFMPPIKSFQNTRMEFVCNNNFELSIRGTLFKNRQISGARQPPLPCLRNIASELEQT